MPTTKNVFASLLAGFGLGLVIATPPRADEFAAGFLTHVNSARANGMGACVATMIGEESAYYNPASVGLFHLDKTLSFVTPHSTKWLPELADDLRLNSWSASVCVSRRPFKEPAGQANFSVGLAYSHTKLSYGMYERVSETGHVIDRYENYDAAHCLAIGVGYRHSVRIGFGYAIKFIDSRLAVMGWGADPDDGVGDGTAHQLGLIVELPVHELTAGDVSTSGTQIEFTPSFAYVIDNLGAGMEYGDVAQADDFPKLSRAGFSFLVAVASGNKEYCSFRGSLESEKLHFDGVPAQLKEGLEFGILRALYGRLGRFETDGSHDAISTYGFGMRLRGLLTGGRRDRVADDGGGMSAYISRHIDLAVDYAGYGNMVDRSLSKTWFYAISVSF